MAAASLVALVLVTVVLGASASHASAQDDEYDSTSDGIVEILDVTYEILPDEERVAATRIYTVKNALPNQYQADGSYRYWTISTYPVSIESDAIDLVIRANGNEVNFEFNDEASNVFFDSYQVDLPFGLRYGNSQTLTVTYSLPSYGPDSDAGRDARRINGAFFDIELVTCCNFEEITARIVMPQGFRSAGPRDPLGPGDSKGPNTYDEELVDGQRIFTFSDNETTGDYTEMLIEGWSGQNDDGYQRTPVSLGGTTVTVVSPPDDEGWDERISTAVAGIGAELERLTGRPWPVANDMFIRQTPGAAADERLDGAGWHGPLKGRVEVPANFNEKHVAYTLARAWFGDVPFSDRWIKEGYTLEFAAQAYEAAGIGTWARRKPAGSNSLTAWIPTLQSYERTHYVISELAQEIGTDGLLELLELAETDETAFVGAGAPELVNPPEDWRRFLDLAEQRLGVEDYSELMIEYVVASVQDDMIAERNATIAEASNVFGEDWSTETDGLLTPVGIRTALSEWDFETSDDITDRSIELLDEQDELASRAAAMDLSPDLSFVQSGFAGVATVDDLDESSERLVAFGIGLDQIEAAEAENGVARGFVPELGLRGTDLDAKIGDAREAFESGDLDAVEARTTELSAELGEADSVGQNRLLLWIVLPVAVAVVLLLVALVWWRRRRQAKRKRLEVAEAEGAEAIIDLTDSAVPGDPVG